MDIPRGGIYIVLGELSSLLTAMKNNVRWSSNSHQDESKDILIRGLTDLKDVLNQINVLRELDPNHFLSPFLEVIRSGETTSLITSIALSAVLKFLNYNLIDPKCEYIAVSVNNIANAVTHAKFVGTDTFNDAVVLMKILQILRTLVMSPIGVMLTNKCICDILLSCFRICFERKLNDTLRKFAESSLRDMVQLLFTRLPTFSEETNKSFNIKKLEMRASSIDVKSKRKSYSKDNISEKSAAVNSDNVITSINEPTVLDMQGNIHKDVPPVQVHNDRACSDGAETPHETDDVPVETVQDMNCTGVVISMEDSYNESLSTQTSTENEFKLGDHHDLNYSIPNGTMEIEKEVNSLEKIVIDPSETIPTEIEPLIAKPSEEISENYTEIQAVNSGFESTVVELYSNSESPNRDYKADHITSISNDGDDQEAGDGDEKQEMVNQQGVRFTSSTEQQEDGVEQPYSLICVQQLLRLLASLCNPLDSQNTVEMLQTGLALVLVALEVGADSIAKFPSLLETVKDELCRSLFSLLNSDRLQIFAADVQVCFLLFESLRTHLKFQFQTFLSKLMDIIMYDNSKISYEMREISLETVVQLWRIPGLVTELYLNYDCDLYCPNLYEELTNFLSKNAVPVPDAAGIHNIHLLSLDALLTVIDSIESHCNSRILNERQNFSEKRGDEEKAMSQVIDPSTNYILREGARHKISTDIPSHEEIMAIKRKKKLLSNGTEKFNLKPKDGIKFLVDQGLLSSDNSEEVATFLRENPHLDKKMIGDYVSHRDNLLILNSFVKSFDFTDTRIDEALRIYLESFRLPGESLLISLLMEHFAEHWHNCNGKPFASADAAFTLAYAIIMLNVDQHNHNVRRQISPMTCDGFKRNLKNVNGNEDFDQKLLDDIYESIKNDEIVMPAEQTGLVRENYLWKLMLRKGSSKDGVYIRAPSGLFDHNLFAIIWSPTVTALGSLFTNTNDPTIYQKTIYGFRKCAMISAHYGMSTEFDNLIVALCKFTTLLNTSESAENLKILFGANAKARLAGKAVFNLAHRHGDIIRDSWGNILDCMLQLYRCKLLPKILVEAEDFIELSGKISLLRDDMMIQVSPKTETSLFSSLYSYISDPNANKGPSAEDLEAIKLAQNSIRECNLEQLITESKFLRFESLQFFIKALLRASYDTEGHVMLGSPYSEGTAVFFLELLLKVIIQNRDRVGVVWPKIKEHIYTLMKGAAASKHQFLVERCVVGLLRLAIRLMRREEMSPVVLQSLRMLLLLKGNLSRVSRQVAYGMFELLKTSAANIHSAADWAVIFTLLECVGAGASPPRVLSKPPINESGAKSEGECGEVFHMPERGYTSDPELNRVGSGSSSPDIHHNTGWILVEKEGEVQAVTGPRIVDDRDLGPHDPFALVKCCESLSFLVRDVAHITPYNFENCVRCIRTFVQAALYITYEKKMNNKVIVNRNSRRKIRGRREDTTTGGGYDADESDADDVPTGYNQQVCIQLMDLMYTLHMRTAQIFRWWAEEEGGVTEYTSLWQCGWCPLLEGISSLCTHPDRQVRMNAISYLQRGLLVSDLSVLTGSEWESCFTRVLFPLLTRLLEPEHNPVVIEEVRIRASTVLSKVFLHHLTPLQTLPSFLGLWMTILDFMDKYMHADNSELLYEAVPESLKNMLLVMDSGGLFTNPDDSRNELWALSWDRILSFLPNLQQELFRPPPPAADISQVNKEPATEDTSPPQASAIEIPSTPTIVESEMVQQPISPAHSHSGVAEEPVSQSIVTASLVTSSPTNWQPPAPIFPHVGQILSTPIGPMISTTILEESNMSSNMCQDTLPVYSGFANAPPRPAPPSAQFFYQDMSQIQYSNLQQNNVESSSSSHLPPNMKNSSMNPVTAISTSEPSS